MVNETARNEQLEGLDIWRERHNSLLVQHQSAQHEEQRSLREIATSAAVTSGYLASMAMVQIIGAPRTPSVMALPTAVEVYERTSCPPLAGIAAGAALGLWNYAASHVMLGGVNRFPRMVGAVSRKVPHTDKLSNVMPGLSASQENQKRTAKASGHFVCGATTFVAGTFPYVAASVAQKHAPEERHKLAKRLGLGAATFIGGIATLDTGSALAAEIIQGRDSKVAAQILETSGDMGLLFKVAIGSLIAQCVYKGGRYVLRRQRSTPPMPKPELAPAYE